MPVNQIPIKTAVRKNLNTKSAAYGKYYKLHGLWSSNAVESLYVNSCFLSDLPD